jgi:hypothetical protein
MISLRAGFWEECLFRAAPLAGATLIGDRPEGRRWWIGGTLVAQALIFGAVHANYPAQPYLNQIAFDMAGPLLGITFTSVAAGLGAGVLHARVGGSRSTPLWRSIAGGVGLSLLGKGVQALTRLAGPARSPPWSSYNPLSKAIPWYDAISGRVGPFALVALVLLLGALTAHRWTGAGRVRHWHVAGGALSGGFAVAGTANPNTIVV